MSLRCIASFLLAGCVTSSCSQTEINLAPVIDRSGRKLPPVISSSTQGVTTAAAGSSASSPPAFAKASAGLRPAGTAAVTGAATSAEGSAAASSEPTTGSVAPIAPVQSLESRELTPIAPAPLPALAAVPALVPGPAAMPLATDPVPSPAPASSWIWPAKGRVASRFHPESLHGADRGIEIAVAEDAEVVAVSDGVVTYTGAPREYGNLVIIRHPDDVLSVYAFTKRILVEKDQHVTQGQQIAVAGSAGDRGPLLHFEVRRRGAAIDPASVLPPL